MTRKERQGNPVTFPRTVQLFLIDGTPSGRIKCSLDNWVGKVYLIPRTEISRSKDRPELSQTGIYLLFGADSTTGDQLLYVGQSRQRKNGNGVLSRVAEHIGQEKLDYFTHAILIIDSDNSFGPTEISYLENAFYQQALTAGRVTVTNGNDPSPGNVTEEKQAALDEFIATAKILIGSLGYRAFDAVDNAKQITSTYVNDLSTVEPLLYLHTSGVAGTGRQTPDGFVILAGAKLRTSTTQSMPESAKKNRERFADRISNTGDLLRDTLFSSPSGAASFLIGSSVNGKKYWKNEAGVTLGELEQAEAKATTSNQ